jgi:hypothetical protein
MATEKRGKIEGNSDVGVACPIHCIDLPVNIFVFDGALFLQMEVFFGREVRLLGRGNHSENFIDKLLLYK